MLVKQFKTKYTKSKIISKNLSWTSAFEVSRDKCSLESCSNICALGITFQLSTLVWVLSSFHNRASSDSLTVLASSKKKMY